MYSNTTVPYIIIIIKNLFIWAKVKLYKFDIIEREPTQYTPCHKDRRTKAHIHITSEMLCTAALN